MLTTSPFDVVKTRMQSTQASAYSSTLDCFAQIARKEGLANFYSGSLARCFRVLPGQGIIFMSAEAIYNLLEQRFPPNGGPTHSKGKGHPQRVGFSSVPTEVEELHRQLAGALAAREDLGTHANRLAQARTRHRRRRAESAHAWCLMLSVETN